MMNKRSFQRSDKVSDLIKREVADILFRQVKDPRIKFVTVTSVAVSKDLKHAKIFFTSIKTGDELKEQIKGLKDAAGFVQRKMGQVIKLRYTPHISFIHDTSLDEGLRMEKLLKEIDSGEISS